MRIETPEVKKTFDDYDIVFVSGIVEPMTLDKSAGDTVEFNDKAGVIIFNCVSRPSINDPNEKLPAEEVTVFTKHLAMVRHRQREVTQLDPEYLLERKQLLAPESKSIH